MDIIVKDQTFEPLAVVDLYNSAIWTERYSEIGDFELAIPIQSAYHTDLREGNYLTMPDTDRMMIIEKANLDSDISTGEKNVVYAGRSLESLLERRIVWGLEELNGGIENILRVILNKNIINPDNPKRKIPDFTFPTVTDPEVLAVIEGITVKCQFTGDSVFDAVKTICDRFGLGFKIIVNDLKKFEFHLFCGTDRTAGQTDRDAIIFSPEYDTLINSRYASDYSNYKNVALVLGEDRGDVRRRAVVYPGKAETTDFYEEDENTPSGLDRRELYVDARDLQSEREDGTTISDEDYMASLETRGYDKLEEHLVTGVFDGEVETGIGPIFGQDYTLGDYVTIQNEFGIGATAQITEYIRSYDSSSGYRAYPTFVMIN